MLPEIEYAIVALGLSPKEVAALINNTVGVKVDPRVDGFLRVRDKSQLRALWKRLSADPRWTKRQV